MEYYVEHCVGEKVRYTPLTDKAVIGYDPESSVFRVEDGLAQLYIKREDFVYAVLPVISDGNDKGE